MARRTVVGAEGRPVVDDAVRRWETQLRKGALELAILAALGSGALYGLEILRRLEESAGLVVPEGTIYPLLGRLKSEGWLVAEWVEAEAGHPRKYYRLAPAGRRHLLALARAWAGFAASMDDLLKPVLAGAERRRR
jgi:PadR family transcriptional regulator PadR